MRMVQCRVVLTPPTRAIRAPHDEEDGEQVPRQVLSLGARLEGGPLAGGKPTLRHRLHDAERPVAVPPARPGPPTSRISRGAGRGSDGSQQGGQRQEQQLDQQVRLEGEEKEPGQALPERADLPLVFVDDGLWFCHDRLPLAPPGAGAGSFGWQGYTGRDAFHPRGRWGSAAARPVKYCRASLSCRHSASTSPTMASWDSPTCASQATTVVSCLPGISVSGCRRLGRFDSFQQARQVLFQKASFSNRSPHSGQVSVLMRSPRNSPKFPETGFPGFPKPRNSPPRI
jgi:hypothetical protein